MGWWVYDLWNTDPVWLVAWVVWVIVSITLHELGHGWAAIRLGDRTPIELGHMTLNPVVHMGTMSLVVFALVGIAWGAMPVSEHRLRGRYASALVALAGPLVNFGLFVLCVVVGAVWAAVAQGWWTAATMVPEPLATNVQSFFWIGAVVSVVLMVFNLLPIPPLDGSRILANVSRGYRRLFFESEQGALVGFGVFLLAFFFLGDYLWSGGFLIATLATEVMLFLITGGQAGGHGGAVTP